MTASPSPAATERLTIRHFARMKRDGRKIAMLTAYDFPTARILDEAGVDCLLVGDTVGMVVQGHDNTLPVTLDQMIYHTEMVARAARRALVVMDLPFGSYQAGMDDAIKAGVRALKETRAQAIKLEGGQAQAELIARYMDAGIPVMAHVGLRPQSVHQLGGYRKQRNRERLLRDATSLAAAGAFAVVLECIPAEIAREITAAVSIPTIGIGAGPHCDGQVLVLHDILGYDAGHTPSFVKVFGQAAQETASAARQFAEEVRAGTFPQP